MKGLFTIVLAILPYLSYPQYFHYLHTYDTTGDIMNNIRLRPDNSLLSVGAIFNYNTGHRDAAWFNFRRTEMQYRVKKAYTLKREHGI